MQPEPAFAKDQVGAVVFNTLCEQLSCVGIEMQSNDLPTYNSCQRNVIPIEGVATMIISDGANVALRASNWFEGWSRFSTSERFCNLLWKFLFPLDLPC